MTNMCLRGTEIVPVSSYEWPPADVLARCLLITVLAKARKG